MLQMGMLEYFRWSWLNWKHYSIPQVGPIPDFNMRPRSTLALTSSLSAPSWTLAHYVQSMFLRYFEENLTRNAFKPGPLEEVGAHRVPAGDDLRVEAEERATKQSEGILVDVGR